uniref:Immunoglobulin domain-containing protein n=1 Tax=Cyprinus carpio carpio TaxID=630221 RepID=A0A9J8AS03_CYPCA
MVGKHSRIMVSAFLVFCLCLRHLVDGTDEVMSVSVMEGDSVSLNTSVTEVQNYHLIQWMFGETRIAEINNLIKINSIYGTDDDKTLQNRLNLDPQTGSLTITNTRTTDSGLYLLILTSGETRSKSFRVTVSESSSSSSCVSSSCAVNNSTLKHTENLNTDCTRCCDTFEAAIRLVIAAVVGVAAVAVLVYDFRSTRSEQHRRDSIKPME